MRKRKRLVNDSLSHGNLPNEVRTRKRLVNEWDGCQAKSRQTTFSTQSSHYRWPTQHKWSTNFVFISQERINELSASPLLFQKKSYIGHRTNYWPQKRSSTGFFPLLCFAHFLCSRDLSWSHQAGLATKISPGKLALFHRNQNFKSEECFSHG